MHDVRRFTVVPSLPEKLEPLRKLANNLWWAWSHDAIFLWGRMDRELWEGTNHNPVKMLGQISQERLRQLENDEGFLAQLERVAEDLKAYEEASTWFAKRYPDETNTTIAYFSAEYGLTECIRMYSGGLGVLAGDHLRSASDMGVPLVAVGLLYHEGYFRQRLNDDGWQLETMPDIDFHRLPLSLVRGDDGQPLKISVELPDGPAVAQIWNVQVGRVPLYVLDANVPENPPSMRAITAQLYGGDARMRIRQEILLGIGGMRALRALGVQPTVCHMNEGHSAFLALERIRLTMNERNLGFREAHEATATGNVFTTHTPVPAGNDRFPPELMRDHFEKYARELKISWEEFLALGREDTTDETEDFCMTVLAVKCADHINGVSRLHGVVSRRMYSRIWPDTPVEEIPIDSITNGVHTKTWISHDMASLFDRYLGVRWGEVPQDPAIWERVSQIPDEELWRTHERRRERLVAFARRRMRRQLERRGAPRREVARADEVLNPEALTIGFARRFATYKRATLLFSDLERLMRLLGDRDRPVQLIFAGKAHPLDDAGKNLIRDIVHTVSDERLRNRIVFLENYDLNVARYLVQGVDVWLNTPRRPLEASGTSGMKAAANGVLNLSVLDGWWEESYDAAFGWAIGRGEEYAGRDSEQDAVESAALYNLLEKDVIPLFYDRSSTGLPRAWLASMKASMMAICPHFNTHRMVEEYIDACYLPAAQRARHLMADDLARAKTLSAWKQRLANAWPHVRVVRVEEDTPSPRKVGETMVVRAIVDLSSLQPEDVRAEIFHGPLNAKNRIETGTAREMSFVEGVENGLSLYRGGIPCSDTGQFGFTVRVVPRHEDLSNAFETRLVRWL